VIAVRSGRTVPASVRQEVLLQPIGVTERLELVFGERRIRAVRNILKKKTMLARGRAQRGRETA
jgi:ParB-like chromosome segregation protein Spo0J